MRQEQFLDVIHRDEAQRRFRAALSWQPLGEETVALENVLGRVLSRDVLSNVDVPSFDRSNVDGFAVRAADTFGAREESPRTLQPLAEEIATAVVPKCFVAAGTAASIATGGMLPRGADAVVMVEHAELEGNQLVIRRAVTAGSNVAFAGTDIAAGETVLRRGELLTSRETGVLAAIGQANVHVWRRPRVAILSTGDEIISPAATMQPGLVYDSNARILADAVQELGGEAILLGIVRDDLAELRTRVATALNSCDVVLLSGGTSKGTGDLSYRVVQEFSDPGILAHGVSLKPGKPICLAVTQGKPLVILPGFPTSAIFTFHEFVAPVLRAFAGRSPAPQSTVTARLAVKVNSEIGRTEFLLVGLVATAENPRANAPPSYAAYPMGKGSGSVTTFSRADGFVTIGQHEEIVDAGQLVTVQLLGRETQIADFVVIGSHCVGLDWLLGQMQDRGFHTKFLAVGSTAGLEAAKRGECDLAGIHLLDATSGEYNRPFVTPNLELIAGYTRWQGFVFRPGDQRFAGQTVQAAIEQAQLDPQCVMVNRNRGSGTRVLIDQLLAGAEPSGYATQPRSHNAVAAAILQGRADWGVAIRSVATQSNLGFLPLTQEHYDFVTPQNRANRPPIQAFRQLLLEPETRHKLASLMG